MKKKSNTIQVRLNDQEYQTLLPECSKSEMQISAYVRACLAGSHVTEMENRREIEIKLVEMYSILNQAADSESKSELMERMNDICRYLKS